MAVDELLKFFLSSTRDVALIELLEIKHSAISRTWRITYYDPKGITVRHEDGQEYHYDYLPLSIVPDGMAADLDSGLRIDLGDLGEMMPAEIDSIAKAGRLNEKPLVYYRIYSSDNLDSPLTGPLVYQVKSVTRNNEGCSLDAAAPLVNASGTGTIYSLDGPFELLRDYLYN